MKPIVLSSIIAMSGALFSTGCASWLEDDDVNYTKTEAQPVAGYNNHMVLSDDFPVAIVHAGGKHDQTEIVEASGAQPVHSENEVVIPLHEERMNVGKRAVDSEQVTIRKVVTSEQVTQPVELRKETLSIEREPAGASREATGAQPFQENAITIHLKEEQPVVEKTTVQTGQVRAKKGSESATREIQGEVRREDVQVDRSSEKSKTP